MHHNEDIIIIDEGITCFFRTLHSILSQAISTYASLYSTQQIDNLML